VVLDVVVFAPLPGSDASLSHGDDGVLQPTTEKMCMATHLGRLLKLTVMCSDETCAEANAHHVSTLVVSAAWIQLTELRFVHVRLGLVIDDTLAGVVPATVRPMCKTTTRFVPLLEYAVPVFVPMISCETLLFAPSPDTAFSTEMVLLAPQNFEGHIRSLD